MGEGSCKPMESLAPPCLDSLSSMTQRKSNQRRAWLGPPMRRRETLSPRWLEPRGVKLAGTFSARALISFWECLVLPFDWGNAGGP